MSEEIGRILIVDDNRVNRVKLSISLEGQGHQVGLAEDGQQALTILKQRVFDVILLDIVMPGMDGFQVLEMVKADPELRDIPVIVISALEEIDSAVRCIEMGAEDYLPKPFNPVLLRARLHASLQKKKLRDLEKAYLRQEVTLRQNEKLATLGKLSAGMAHELNNPAAAVLRSAAQLQAAIDNLKRVNLHLADLDLSPPQMQALLEIDRLIQDRAKQLPESDDLSGSAAITRSDREAEVEAWLSAKEVLRAWEFAPSLVNIGLSPGDLETFDTTFSAAQLQQVIEWLHCTYTASMLVNEIGVGAGRISELVRALKSYAYLDQAPLQPVDIHQGLDDTLVILRSKLKQGVAVQRQYAPDLPHILAYGSELNQVWTNLIDNAIDALLADDQAPAQPVITLRTFKQGEWVLVEVEDNGPGIPEQALSRLFDPFFTTKPPGKGTGLGLNISHNIIVQKHHGKIDVESRPGETRFTVHLPIHPDGSQTEE
jgi:signal transduction histidine kinase